MRADYKLPLIASILFWFLLQHTMPVYSAASGYYEIPGRPRDAFSKCCCEKDPSSTSTKFIFNCKFDGTCSENAKAYNSVAGDCPGVLMYTKQKDLSQ